MAERKEKESKQKKKRKRLIMRRDPEQHLLNRVAVKELYYQSKAKTASYTEKRSYPKQVLVDVDVVLSLGGICTFF